MQREKSSDKKSDKKITIAGNDEAIGGMEARTEAVTDGYWLHERGGGQVISLNLCIHAAEARCVGSCKLGGYSTS